jgi:cardiolipin synthase
MSEIRKATHPDRIELVYSGEDYFSRLEQIIQNVQYEIHLQFYIFKMMPLDRANLKKLQLMLRFTSC